VSEGILEELSDSDVVTREAVLTAVYVDDIERVSVFVGLKEAVLGIVALPDGVFVRIVVAVLTAMMEVEVEVVVLTDREREGVVEAVNSSVGVCT
jgi:hypothetical protein